MRYIEISEPIFRDLMAAKSKVEDLKLLLLEPNPAWTKKELMEELMLLAFSGRYEVERGEDLSTRQS